VTFKGCEKKIILGAVGVMPVMNILGGENLYPKCNFINFIYLSWYTIIVSNF
jgi:hypothetical protein